jgi:hypothetical protein
MTLSVFEKREQADPWRHRQNAQVLELIASQQLQRPVRLFKRLARHANAMASCRSFDDVMRAFRAMQTLG